MKRSRELNNQARQQEKDARKAQRKQEKGTRPKPGDGEDPDLAGIVAGPQPTLADEEKSS